MPILQPDFPALASLCGALGALVLALSLPGVAAPAAAGAFWRRFPRCAPLGWIFSAVAVAWSFLWLPPLLMEFAPSVAGSAAGILRYLALAAYFALVLALPDLLACRSAGLLLVLAPGPLLSAAQWHPSSARFFPIALAYAMAVCGMFVTARPWLLRDAVLRANSTPGRTRAVSAVFLALALALLACAFVVFPVASGAEPLR